MVLPMAQNNNYVEISFINNLQLIAKRSYFTYIFLVHRRNFLRLQSPPFTRRHPHNLLRYFHGGLVARHHPHRSGGLEAVHARPGGDHHLNDVLVLVAPHRAGGLLLVAELVRVPHHDVDLLVLARGPEKVLVHALPRLQLVRAQHALFRQMGVRKVHPEPAFRPVRSVARGRSKVAKYSVYEG